MPSRSRRPNRAGTKRSRAKPELSVIIAVPPGLEPLLESRLGGRGRSGPPPSWELLVVEGHSPSKQRNLGASKARGEILYFLDDDSEPIPKFPSRIVRQFKARPQLGVLGGPDLARPSSKGVWEQACEGVMASWAGSGPVRARYSRERGQSPATEKNLILCNLAVRKGLFLKHGGFREELYPNEENEFLNRLQEAGSILARDASLWVRRDRPSGPSQMWRQALSYGRGRGSQMRLGPRWTDLPHLAGPFLLVGALGLWALFGWRGLVTAGLAAGALLLAGSLEILFRHGKVLSALLSPWILILRHLGYSLGLFWGLCLGPLPRPKKPCRIRRVGLFRRWASG